jgi:tripartite ATP-independent transporter DctP family solute receptor
MNRRTTLVLALSLATAACVTRDDVTVIKLAHGLDPTHPVHQAMEFLAERVREESGGTMRVDIYPSEQLGTERQALELLQIGSLGMTKVSAAVLENFAAPFRVLSLPYIFQDEAHQWAVLEGPIGREMLDMAARFRLRGLCFYDAGSRSFYTKDRPILAPSDLAGLKIRTQESATATRMVSLLGGSATPIAWGELYTALQQGVVDGAENNPPSFHLSRHYEVARYYSLNEHTGVPDVLLISTVVWNDLTPEQQRWLQQAAHESAQHQKSLWQQATEEALRIVQADGVQVLRPDKAPFAALLAPMYEDYRDEPAVYELIERIRATAAIGGDQH